MSLENRVDRIEYAILIMKDLLVNHRSRFDDQHWALEEYYRAMREPWEDFEFRLNALIDAQMRNQTDIAELKSSTIKLRAASKSQLERIEDLENTN